MQYLKQFPKIFRLRPKVRGKNVLPESSTGEGAPGRGAAAYYLSETDRPAFRHLPTPP